MYPVLKSIVYEWTRCSGSWLMPEHLLPCSFPPCLPSESQLCSGTGRPCASVDQALYSSSENLDWSKPVTAILFSLWVMDLGLEKGCSHGQVQWKEESAGKYLRNYFLFLQRGRDDVICVV